MAAGWPRPASTAIGDQRHADFHARRLARGSRTTGERPERRRQKLRHPKIERMRILPAALAATLFSTGLLPAQTPFQFPTANHALYEPGQELKFFAPTAPDKPWTSGSFGCVRSDGWQMHEGLDIRHLQTDRHGEPTDPVHGHRRRHGGLCQHQGRRCRTTANTSSSGTLSKGWKFIRSTRT